MDTKLASPFALLKQAWALGYSKSNVLLFLGLGTLPQILSFGFSALLAYAPGSNNLESTITDFLAQTNGWMIAAIGALALLGIVLMIYVGTWYSAFLYRVYEATVSGSNGRLSSHISSARLVTKRLFFTSIKVGVYATIGFLLFVIPGIIITVRYAFAPLIATLEDSSVSPLGESKRLVKNRFWKLAGRGLIPFFLYSIPLSLFQSLHPLLGALWSLSSPVFGLYFYLVYLDFKRTAAVPA
ncbi:MAG: hypothetical protein Q8L37_07830 [Candidatus Gottesmanbacteria bacterium]|nr:hypothetical protein [Candidatus Gottesmanbacteria bacterium]